MDVPSSANCIQWYAEAIDKIYDEVAPTGPNSLALVLFRMLAGALPFRAQDTQELMVQRLTGTPLRLDEEGAWTGVPALQLPPACWQLWTPNKALGLTGVRGAYAESRTGKPYI